MPFTRAQLITLFTYHTPTPDQVEHYQAIRTAALEFASVVIEHTPTCGDQTFALRLIRTAQMTANASIALQGKF